METKSRFGNGFNKNQKSARENSYLILRLNRKILLLLKNKLYYPNTS